MISAERMLRHVRRQSFTKVLGTVLILCGLLGLYGWVNHMEPDCFYSDRVGLQIRLCGENYTGREPAASAWVPAAFFTVLLGGIILQLRSRPGKEGRRDVATR